MMKKILLIGIALFGLALVSCSDDQPDTHKCSCGGDGEKCVCAEPCECEDCVHTKKLCDCRGNIWDCTCDDCCCVPCASLVDSEE